MEDRIIIYVTLEPFYAAIEQRDHPEWCGMPIAVCFNGETGTVASASREAMARGVRIDQPKEVAKRCCPNIHFVKGDYATYQDIWLQLKQLFSLFSGQIEYEQKGCAFLDMSHAAESGHTPVDMASNLHKAITEATGLHPTIGVSHNRFLAKAATFSLEPGRVKAIPPQCTQDAVDNLAIDQLWLASDRTKATARNMGLTIARELRGYAQEELMSLFGKAEGKMLYQLLKGIDNSPLRIPGQHIPHDIPRHRSGNGGGQQLTLDLF